MPEQTPKSNYSGSLTQISFPKLLYHLFAAKLTGRLLLTRGETGLEIFIDRGEHLLPVSRIDTEGIGASQDVFHDSVIDVFTWRSGQYTFFQEQLPSGLSRQTKLESWPLISDGVRKGYKMSELDTLLSPYKKWFLGRKHNPNLRLEGLGLGPEEYELFEIAARQPCLEDLLSRYAPDEKAMSMVLSTLYLGLELDLLSLAPQPQTKATLPQATEPITQPAKQPAESIEESSLSGEEQALLDILNRLKQQDFFERLGLERTCSSQEVNQSFLKIARKHHPDQLPQNVSQKMRALGDQVFSLFNEAHQKLSDHRFRAEYLAALEAGFKDEKVDIGNIVESENLFEKAGLLIKARNYNQALAELEKAIQINPDEGEFHIYRGYVMYLAHPNPEAAFTRRCVEIIQSGLKMRNDRVAAGYLFLGRIENTLGNQTKAEAMYKKALGIDPNDMEAARELRLLDMRKSKDKNKFKKWPWGK